MDEQFKKVDKAIDELLDSIPDYGGIMDIIGDLQLNLRDLQQKLEREKLIKSS